VSADATRTVWVTRQRTTVRHIRGLLEGLETANALDFAEVKIMTLEDGAVVTLPGGHVLTQDNLPPEGLLLYAEAPDG
jgi:hypothetical protein